MQPVLSLSGIHRVGLKEPRALQKSFLGREGWDRDAGNWKENGLLQLGICSEAPGGKRDENIHFLDPVSEHSTLSNRRREQFSWLMRLRLLLGAWNRMPLSN